MTGGRAGTGRAAIGRFRRVGWWSGVDPAPTEIPRRGAKLRFCDCPQEVKPCCQVRARLRQQLRKYGIELRKLAYSLPDGVGEHDLLHLSEQLISAADQP